MTAFLAILALALALIGPAGLALWAYRAGVKDGREFEKSDQVLGRIEEQVKRLAGAPDA